MIAIDPHNGLTHITSVNIDATNTANAPLIISIISTEAAAEGPRTLRTFVAPVLPLP